MQILGIVALVLAALLAVFILVVAMRPAAFAIERSREIKASPATIFPLLNDFHAWAQWSPWEKMDPNLQRTFSGKEAGPGAVYDWTGNNKVGTGRMTITESKPNDLVSIRLEFIKPFAATNQAIFTLAPTATGTLVRWRMEGQHGFMGKAFSMLMSMEKMVGPDFERGLANLDAATHA